MLTFKKLMLANKKALNVALTATTLMSFGHAYAADTTPFSTESWYAIGGSGLFYPDADLDAKDDTPGVHFRLGKEVTDNIDIQAGVSYNRVREDSPSFSGGHYKQLNFTVDALYLLSRDKFRPFLLAGIGASNNKVNYDIAPGFTPTGKVTGSNTSFAGNVGLGFQYLLNDKLGIQADFRRIFSDVEVGTSELSHSKGSTANNQLNFGLLYRFGGKPAIVAVPEPVAAPVEKIVEVIKYEPAPVVPPPAPLVFEKQTFNGSALFALNSDALSETGKYELKTKIANKMLEYPEVVSVTIEGHTDRLGSKQLNDRLSLSRANTVKGYLVNQGVAESRLYTIGKGSSDPIVNCSGTRSKKVIDCLQPNRRVVIAIETQKLLQGDSPPQ